MKSTEGHWIPVFAIKKQAALPAPPHGPTVMFHPVPLGHTGDGSSSSLSCLGVHTKPTITLKGMLGGTQGSTAAFLFYSKHPGWYLSQASRELEPGLLPADTSNWIPPGAVQLGEVTSPGMIWSLLAVLGCCEQAAEVLQSQGPCPVWSSLPGTDRQLSLGCKNRSIASTALTGSPSPAPVTVTSLGSIARTAGCDLWMTTSAFDLQQNPSPDGGIYPRKTA